MGLESILLRGSKYFSPETMIASFFFVLFVIYVGAKIYLMRHDKSVLADKLNLTPKFFGSTAANQV